MEIDKENIKELSGLAYSKVPVLIKNIEMQIGNYSIPVRIAWALIEEVPPILGRLDIFNKFVITFDEDSKVIRFEYKK